MKCSTIVHRFFFSFDFGLLHSQFFKLSFGRVCNFYYYFFVCSQTESLFFSNAFIMGLTLMFWRAHNRIENKQFDIVYVVYPITSMLYMRPPFFFHLNLLMKRPLKNWWRKWLDFISRFGALVQFNWIEFEVSWGELSIF